MGNGSRVMGFGVWGRAGDMERVSYGRLDWLFGQLTVFERLYGIGYTFSLRIGI